MCHSGRQYQPRHPSHVATPDHSGLEVKTRTFKEKTKAPKKRTVPIYWSEEEYSTSSSSESSSESSDSDGKRDEDEQSVHGHFDPVDRKISHKLPQNLDKFSKGCRLAGSHRHHGGAEGPTWGQ